MAIEVMSGVVKGSIADVKKSPMDLFKKSKELNQAIYILNRNDVAGVVLNKELYEDMIEIIEKLEEKVFDMETALRLEKIDSQETLKTYGLEETIGHDLTDVEFDGQDGWE